MRASAPWGVLVVLAAPAPTWALGLGDIELQSALNQPFRAEIGLTGTAEELQSLRVNVADRATFERSGLERPLFMSGFNFQVRQNAAGRNVIAVTSAQSVAEPFVTMIIEAAWSNGVLLREYTVFLDPPVLLARPQAETPIAAPQTRAPAPQTAAAPIARQPAVTPAPAPAPAPRATAPVPQGTGREGTHGPVQRSETLWAIAERYQPSGTTMNQMMVAIYEANREAFGGNINVLRAGTILRIPSRDDVVARSTANANAEVQRQNEAWRQGTPAATSTNDRLVLVPPSTDDVVPSTTSGRGAAGDGAAVTALRSEVDTLRAELEESRRLLEIRNRELSDLQRQLGDDEQAAPTEAAVVDNTEATPGVDIESEQVFADTGEVESPVVEEPVAEEPAAEEPVAQAPVPEPAAQTRPAPTRAARTPTLLERVTGWLSGWMALVVAGVGAILFVGLWFMRGRRDQDVEDVTGHWDALEAGMDQNQRGREPRMSAPSSRSAADRSSLEQALSGSPFVVEERASASSTTLPIEDAEEIAAEHFARVGEQQIDDTMSTSAVLNLDEADPVAEADFHMAYGLYDQAAELLSKELKQHPNRRDLQLKLLEVFFVWGNKDEFLDAAQHLRDQMGAKVDGDWDKVLIMGKQICPDADLFAEAAVGGGAVDVALGTGDTGSIDFSFDDSLDSEEVDLLDVGDATTAGFDDEIDLDLTGNRPSPALDATGTLNIGADTAAGLEAALFEESEADEDAETLAVGRIDPESLIETQETPALRSSAEDLWADPTIESPTVEQIGTEQPTVESPGLDTGETMLQSTAVIDRDDDEAMIGTAEMPGLHVSTGTEYTAELELNDLGLDVSGIDDALGLDEIASELDNESGDTREQPVLEADAELLSATGITQVLREETGTKAFGADDQTQLQAGGTMLGAAELKARADAETEMLELPEDEFDLDLDDLSAALADADTIEQPQSVDDIDFGLSSTSSTPVDLDVGETYVSDDDPTGTEDIRGMDPQTLTEVGTKLDLARAYIDMGDPEGARSILEEVLAEGDGAQRDEARGLIDAIGA